MTTNVTKPKFEIVKLDCVLRDYCGRVHRLESMNELRKLPKEHEIDGGFVQRFNIVDREHTLGKALGGPAEMTLTVEVTYTVRCLSPVIRSIEIIDACGVQSQSKRGEPFYHDCKHLLPVLRKDYKVECDYTVMKPIK